MEARQMLHGEMGGGAVIAESVTDSDYTMSLKHKWSNGEFAAPGGKKYQGNYLQGLKPTEATVLALMLENESRYLGKLNEDTLSTNAGTFTKWALPMVRRLYTNQILPKICTVQPVNGKYGVVQTMAQVYDQGKGAKVPLGGITNGPKAMAYDGMMVAGDEAIKNSASNYVNEFVDYHAVCSDTGAGAEVTFNNTLANCVALSRQWGPIRSPGTSGQRLFYVKAYWDTTEAVVGARIGTLEATGTVMRDQDGNNVGSCDVTTGAWTINAVLAGGGASAFKAHQVIYFQYFFQSELAYTVSGGKIQSMSLSSTQYPIVAEPFPLRTTWTLEGELSWQSQQQMDFESEVVSMLAGQQAFNVDQYGIDLMIAGAAHSATYTYAGTFPGNMEKIEDLPGMIGAVSAAIQNASRRGPANFCVMNPSVWALMGRLSHHADWFKSVGVVSPASHNVTTSDFGIQYAGTLPGTMMDVYLNPVQDATKVLVGYKGSNWLDAGFVYAPWIPLMITDTLTTPDTLTKSKAIVSYGSLKMLRGEYYGVVTVSGLPSVVSVIP